MNIKYLTPFRTPYRLTQSFGARPYVYEQYGFMGHEGIDLVPAPNSSLDVLSLFDGIVITDDDEGLRNYGNHVRIFCPSINTIVWYCHLAENHVEKGQEVKAREKIGEMGNTGNSSGAHLHLSCAPVDDERLIRLYFRNGYKGLIDPINILRVVA